MNNLLPSVTDPAIKQLLLRRLQTVLGLYIPDASVLTQQAQNIYLDRAKDCGRVLYVSGLAFQLSQVKKIPALEIASALSSKLVVDIATLFCDGAESSAGDADEVECCWRKQPIVANLLQFTVQVVPPGWIHLEVTEPTIAAWLQRLVSPPQLQNISKQEHQLTLKDTSCLFAVQYAHARCCSLLQMAHREKLITLKEALDTKSAAFLIIAPDPIPWLNSNQIRCCHPAERALISQLVETLDDLYCPYNSRQPGDWEKAALNLSQAFQSFYSCCRIWGKVKIQTFELAQVRLGLVMATQVVLRLLLQDRLGIPAPLEL